MNKKIVEVLRSHCRYHTTFALIWVAWTLLSIHYDYSWISAFDGIMLCYHANKAWGAYRTASILSDDRVIEVVSEEEKEEEGNNE
jgi:hypothetical protein